MTTNHNQASDARQQQILFTVYGSENDVLESGSFFTYQYSVTQREFARKCQEWWADGCSVVTWKADQ